MDQDLRIECDLSGAPDEAWKRAIADYEVIARFFHRITVTGATLTAEFDYTEQPEATVIEAINRRIASANTRTNRSN